MKESFTGWFSPRKNAKENSLIPQRKKSRRLKVFEETIDMIMLQYHSLYEQCKDRIEEEEFDKTKERKKMNEFIKAIVILYQNKDTRL